MVNKIQVKKYICEYLSCLDFVSVCDNKKETRSKASGLRRYGIDEGPAGGPCRSEPRHHVLFTARRPLAQGRGFPMFAVLVEQPGLQSQEAGKLHDHFILHIGGDDLAVVDTSDGATHVLTPRMHCG